LDPIQQVGGDGVNGITRSNTIASVVATDGNIHLDAGSAKAMYLNFYSGTSGVNFGNGATGIIGSMSSTGLLTANASVYTPIFYDNNNSGYYVDPASTSNLNSVNAVTLTASGTSYASGTGGFASSTYAVGARNPIWRFGNADGYGLSYFQGTAGIGSQDTIGVHFGTATAAGSPFQFRADGYAYVSGYLEGGASVRGPIFYDSNNTGYYIDPTSSSNINTITAQEYYTNGWFRNNDSNEGLYNTTTTQHLSSNTNGYWDMSSTTTVSAIRFYTGGHVTSLRGYVYANNGNEIGFLNSAGSWSLRCDNSGNTTATGDVTAYSDRRVKENIETVTGALDKVNKLRGVYYNRVDSEDKQRKVGVIAQEVLEVLPEVVGQDSDGMYNVAYGNMAGLFIEAIKEQQTQIDELKQLVKQLTQK
jgi:hypothetical protein